jgi:hypothetical protein
MGIGGLVEKIDVWERTRVVLWRIFCVEALG